MSVARFLTIDGDSFAEYSVGGSTFAPLGDITTLDGKHAEKTTVRTTPVDKLVEISAICNDAKISYNSETDTYTNVGEPTEAALKVLVEKLASDSDSFNSTLSSLSPLARATAVNDHYDSRIQRLLTFEFSRDRKSMSVLTNQKINTPYSSKVLRNL